MEVKPYKYQSIAAAIAQQIRDEVLLPGSRAPSLRTVCRQFKVSQRTAITVYHELEAGGFVEARPKSGYYVSNAFRKLRSLPAVSTPDSKKEVLSLEDNLRLVFQQAQPGQLRLSDGVLQDELLPVARLSKGMVQAMRRLKGSGTAYGDMQGNPNLRRQIVRHSADLRGLVADDVVTTAGCVNAMTYALMATTNPGDVVAVESPVYFGILRLARSLKLKVLELPTHPQTGMEPAALQQACEHQQVKAVVLISSFSNPLGSLMPDDHKQAIVNLMAKYRIPLIEDDIYAELFFGEDRPVTCKSFDTAGWVILCSSFSKTLAPGYRVGWTIPGRFKQEVLGLKLAHTVSAASLPEEVIADFLEHGRYAHHLRKIRRTLHSNSLVYRRAIDRYFPEGTSVSVPAGGMFLWVEFDRRIDTLKLHDLALRAGISIAPGIVFSLQEQFRNCIRLNYGLYWTVAVEKALQTLGALAAGLLK